MTYFRLTPLLGPPAGAQVTGLNALGDACGYGFANNEAVGIIWYTDGLVVRGPNQTFNAINNAQVAVGMGDPDVGAAMQLQPPYYNSIAPSSRAIFHHAGVSTPFGPAGSLAFCISEPTAAVPHGVILGFTSDFNSPTTETLVLRAGTLHHLPLPSGVTSCFPVAINAKLDFCGSVSGPSVDTYMIVKSGVWIRLTDSVSVWDMNESCQAVGRIIGGSAANPDYLPALWDASSVPPGPSPQVAATQLPLPPGCWGGEAYGIEDKGWVVGTAYPYNANYDRSTGLLNPDNIAFIYDGTSSTDLNTLVTAPPGWKLQSALKIVEERTIIGLGTFNGANASFLLRQA